MMGRARNENHTSFAKYFLILTISDIKLFFGLLFAALRPPEPTRQKPDSSLRGWFLSLPGSREERSHVLGLHDAGCRRQILRVPGGRRGPGLRQDVRDRIQQVGQVFQEVQRSLPTR